MNRLKQSGELDVWFCFTGSQQVQGLLPRYETLLSEAEQSQYQQFSHADQRRDYLVSRALLRTVLASYCDVEASALEFGVNAFGKPELRYPQVPNLQFNTAHTHGLSVCVVGNEYLVGIDTEYHSDSASLLKVAEDYFSSLELQALNEHSCEEEKLSTFFRLWTLKEAYLKARGEGLSIPLHDFSLVLENNQVKQFLGPDADRWDFRLLLQNQNYTAAIAVEGKVNQLNLYDYTPLGEAVPLDLARLK